MSQTERTRDTVTSSHTAGTGPAAPDGEQLAGAQASARQIAQAGQDAIDRALSQDSEEFLHSARQRSAE